MDSLITGVADQHAAASGIASDAGSDAATRLSMGLPSVPTVPRDVLGDAAAEANAAVPDAASHAAASLRGIRESLPSLPGTKKSSLGKQSLGSISHMVVQHELQELKARTMCVLLRVLPCVLYCARPCGWL